MQFPNLFSAKVQSCLERIRMATQIPTLDMKHPTPSIREVSADGQG